MEFCWNTIYSTLRWKLFTYGIALTFYMEMADTNHVNLAASRNLRRCLGGLNPHRGIVALPELNK